MNFRDLTVGAYLKLHELIASRSKPPLVPFLGYEYPEGQPDLIYDWQERDFTRELVNAFNRYALWLERLGLWEEVDHLPRMRSREGRGHAHGRLSVLVRVQRLRLGASSP